MHLTTAAGKQLATANSIEGLPVNSASGQKLGEISGVVLDLERGAIVYLVVSAHAGLFGISGKYTPVPWAAFSFDPERRAARVPFDLETLQRAPAYYREQLDSDVYGWDDQVSRFFHA